jgi:hypothetical protein
MPIELSDSDFEYPYSSTWRKGEGAPSSSNRDEAVSLGDDSLEFEEPRAMAALGTCCQHMEMQKVCRNAADSRGSFEFLIRANALCTTNDTLHAWVATIALRMRKIMVNNKLAFGDGHGEAHLLLSLPALNAGQHISTTLPWSRDCAHDDGCCYSARYRYSGKKNPIKLLRCAGPWEGGEADVAINTGTLKMQVHC